MSEEACRVAWEAEFWTCVNVKEKSEVSGIETVLLAALRETRLSLVVDGRVGI